ncbi:putative Alpha/Beta hydrolase protein [Seiridium cardinale]|uniref:Carboxylic ester hydrolase n=1 Tax=Seiridium cardinale TaxID=138064 RepID=A0ABR2XEU6_9PEZI
MHWVKENISAFGGDPQIITLGGRSAGSYGVEAQVLHDFRGEARHAGEELFHRFYMISNTIPAQPKTLAESQPQFDEICSHFAIPQTATGAEKLSSLRPLGWGDLVSAILLNEEALYATYNAPKEPNLAALRRQICNYYAPSTTYRIIEQYSLPNTEGLSEWRVIFGSIMADGQVRAPSRGLVHNLARHGILITDIWRYRVAKRLSFITEKVAPASFGVSHAMGKPWWNFSIQHGPTEKEKALMQEWIDIQVAFTNDDRSYEFGTRAIDEMTVVTSEDAIEVQKDNKWYH